MAEDVSRAEGSIQSVERAFDLVEALSREELALVELARRVGLHPSTAHRMLTTLVGRGYVQRRPSGLYALGRRAGYLGVSLCVQEQAIKAAAEPIMRSVNRVSKHTVNLAVLEGGSIVFVAYRSGEHPAMQRPEFLPAHVTASGKVLMAYAELGRRHLRERLEALTSRTITDHDELRLQLEQVRDQGWAVSMGEYREGVACVAAPIFGPSRQVVATMSVAGPEETVLPQVDDLIELVSTAAADVSHALGYLEPEGLEPAVS
jgi:IclR family acetate operon transcriptional repressor